ncbi:VPA1269 family protein, partial [Pseudoalteromonas rubra]|uniref:VPA1269 family protein n=1 Tax=Pseudoalteromonas rubra TaxID=43658 RepID=UPI0012881A93
PVNSFVELLNSTPITRKKKWLASVSEFLNWVLEMYLTIEDSDTGEVSRVNNARNPFRYVNFDNEIASHSFRGETDKLALPYEYTNRARDWIFPADAHVTNS